MPEMKIHQLAHGARFEYEGEEYVKTGPLFATGKGGPRLIPRYAVLQPLPASRETAESEASQVPKATVLSAFDAFFAECAAMLPDDRRSELEAGRARFLKAIG
ncbi:MAG: hypothetical protein QM739_02175 [Propionivibrio sp.]